MEKQLTDVRALFTDKEAYGGKTVSVGGWVRNIRDSKTFGFIVLNDGTCFTPLQVVFAADKLSNFSEITKLNVGAAVVCTGEIVLTPEAKQPFEMQAAEITVEGASTPDYPIQPKKHSMEFLRTLTHLRARTNTFEAVFRVRSLAAYAIHKFFQERDFVYVHTPIITGSDAEGAGEMFQVTTMPLESVPMADGAVDYTKDFFGRSTDLTVSGQLNGETFAQAFKFQHHPPCGGVLDDRAGDGVLRSRRGYGDRRGDDQVYYLLRFGARAGGNGVFQPVHGQGTDRAFGACEKFRLRADYLYGRNYGAGKA